MRRASGTTILGAALCALLAGTAIAADDATSPVTAPSAAKPSALPPAVTKSGRPRVWVRELAGSWVSAAFLDALRAGKPLGEAVRAAPMVAIGVHRVEAGYHVVVTDFRKRVEQGVVDVQPDGKPGHFRLALGPDQALVSLDQMSFIAFEGARGAEGRFSQLRVREPYVLKRPLELRHLDESLDVLVNRAVIAGGYNDAQGKRFDFSDAGQATLPDGAFAYRVAAGAKGCDLLLAVGEEGEAKARFGFAASKGELRLYGLTATKGGKQTCEAQPQWVLKRQEDAPKN